MSGWQPNEQLVRHMVGLFHDIQSQDNDRQMVIFNEFNQLQTRTDFALYLTYITSGCPGLPIEIQDHARISACSRLARVFRNKTPERGQNLDEASSNYIRDECLKYVTVPHHLIRTCVMDVLAYLCVYQQLKGWEAIFNQVNQWIQAPQPVTEQNPLDMQEIGFQFLAQLLSNITSYEELTENFHDSRWKTVFDPMFNHIVVNLLSANANVRLLCVKILDDCVPSLPDVIFTDNGAALRITMTNNLYILTANDAGNPKTSRAVMSLLSTLAILSINNVVGADLSQLTLEQLQIHAHNNPVPQITQQLNLASNCFALIDNFILLAAQFMTTAHHTNCGHEFNVCDTSLDLVASEATNFIITILSSQQFEKAVSVSFRTTLMKRHVHHILPRLFACAKYTGCDVVRLDAEHRASLLVNQIAPHWANNSTNNSSPSPQNEDDADYDPNDDDNDDRGGEDDEEDSATNKSTLRRYASGAITTFLLTVPEESIQVFLSYVDGALSSTSIPDRECGLLLLGFFGQYCGEALMDRLTSFIPQLLKVLGSDDQNHMIMTIIAWTIGRLREIIIKCDSAGMRSEEGLSIIQIFFTQAVKTLKTTRDSGQKYALLHAITAFSEYQQTYLYFVEFYRHFYELALVELTTSQDKETVIAYLDFFCTLVAFYTDALEDGTIPKDFYINSIATPFVGKCITVDVTDEALPDWLLALHALIFTLPKDFLQTAASPIYFRTLELVTSLTTAIRESVLALEADPDADSGLEWQYLNATAASFDCLSALTEMVGAAFLQLALQSPPATLLSTLPQAAQRVLLALQPTLGSATPDQQQAAMREVMQYQSLITLADAVITTLNYNDLSARQGSFGALSELCTHIPTHPLLTQLYFWATRIAPRCITASPEEVDLVSATGWFLRVLVEHHGEAAYNHVTVAPDGTAVYPIQEAVQRCLRIGILDTKAAHQNSRCALLTLSTMTQHVPMQFLNTALQSCSNDMKATNNILNCLFKIVIRLTSLEEQWATLRAFLSILPLLVSNTSTDMSVSVVGALTGTAMIIARFMQKQASGKTWKPKQDVVVGITTLLTQSSQANPQLWQQCWGQLAPEYQQAIMFLLQPQQ